MNTTMQITMLPTSKLYHHPNNARTEYEEIPELAETIRARGVLQNLTVVPYDPTWHSAANVADPNDAYIVIIGNRRLEGALMANVAEVPCVISDMDIVTQLAVMDIENHQRKNTSPYKQAQNYQMMLNLGETEKSIADRTGYSITTVRNRLKLLELDQEKFKASESRGASMTDYIELSKIKDADRRNQVLESIGTRNFQADLKRALERDKADENIANIISTLQSFAKEIAGAGDVPNTKYVASYYLENHVDIQIPADADSVNYYYTRSSFFISLYRDKFPEEEAESIEKQKAIEKSREQTQQLKELNARTFNLRCDFVKSITPTAAKKNLGETTSFLVDGLLRATENCGHYYSEQRKLHVPNMARLLDIDYDETAKELDRDALESLVAKAPAYVLLCAAISMWDKPELSYARHDYGSTEVEYVGSDTLDYIYDFLAIFGYQMSDEELALQNGNHPIFSADEATE